MSIDEVMERTIEYGLMMRTATISESRALNTSIRAAIEQHVAKAVKAERLAIIKALPGGHYADPQQIADMIRDRGVDEVTP